jgi:hypothetical protein
MPKQRSIVPLNSGDDAFRLFSELLTPSVTDVRGETVFVDIGDYVHLMQEEQRLERVSWILETLTNPEEIRKGHRKETPFREVYINRVYRDEHDMEGEVFVVGVNRGFLGLDFRTAFLPRPSYLAQISKGQLIWKATD